MPASRLWSRSGCATLQGCRWLRGPLIQREGARERQGPAQPPPHGGRSGPEAPSLPTRPDAGALLLYKSVMLITHMYHHPAREGLHLGFIRQWRGVR